MKKVSDVLARKGSKVTSVNYNIKVKDALQLMADKNIGSVLVMKDDQYLGLMTERDYSRKVVLKGKASNDTLVADIMTTDLPIVHPADTIENCMQHLSEKHIRYLPVFDQDKIAGIISINDVVNEIISSQQETISNLKDYLYSNA